MRFTGFQNNKASLPLRNDCTVRALATVTGIPYGVMFEALAVYGRKAHAGFAIDTWLKTLGHEAFGHLFVRSTVTESGVYLCYNQGHAWAVIDGVLYDNVPGGRRYTHAFRVYPCPEESKTKEVLEPARERASRFLED